MEKRDFSKVQTSVDWSFKVLSTCFIKQLTRKNSFKASSSNVNAYLCVNHDWSKAFSECENTYVHYNMTEHSGWKTQIK